jgi:trehalose/maltose transport system substrate-binding protein
MQKALVGLLAGVAVLVASPAAAAGVTISISCGSVGQDLETCKQGAEAWAKATGNTVKTVTAPADSNQQLTLFQQLLSTGSADVDVFRIDIIWPGILGNHLLDLKKYIPEDALKEHFAPIVQANTVDGQLKALPWFTDAGVLYYRKDLLEKYGQKPPTTWQELADTAKLILEKERAADKATKLQGFVFQGKAYEGLTCNALEWIDSFGGGSVIDDTGKVTVNNPKAVAAITFFAGLIGNVVPKGVLNYAEEEARGAFQSGQAIFMRNWPYAWSLSQSADSPVKGKVGVVALPMGPEGKHTGTLGGWNLAVSKYSKNPEVAADLVKFLGSAKEQKRRAIEASLNPTIGSLYKDPDVLKASPFFGTLYDTFTNAVSRPSKKAGVKYNQVSTEFYNSVYATLSGKGKAEANLKKLQDKLEKLSKGGKWQ